MRGSAVSPCEPARAAARLELANGALDGAIGEATLVFRLFRRKEKTSDALAKTRKGWGGGLSSLLRRSALADDSCEVGLSGADGILTYFAVEAAKRLKSG